MKNDEIKIIEMKPQDISTIKMIEAEGGLSIWNEKGYLREIERTDSHAKIIKFKGQISGFILARLITKQTEKSFNSAEIFNIAVEKKQRKKGFGSLMLKNLIDICRTNDISEIWLEVRKSNRSAHCFYSKYGFEVIAERKNYYTNPSEDALIMKCILQ